MRRFSLFLILSVCVHAGLLLTLSVSVQTVAEQTAKTDDGKPFSLVNIAVREEPEEEAPSPPKSAALSEPAPSQIPVISDLTEHYLEQLEQEESAGELEPGELETMEGNLEEAAMSAEHATPGNTGTTAGNAAQTADYARRNYTYIQRRIRDRLVYPAPARRAGIQGVTEIAFTIHEDGRVSTVTIQKSSGHTVLDEAAIETVLAAAPFPRPPAPARLAIPISFRLR